MPLFRIAKRKRHPVDGWGTIMFMSRSSMHEIVGQLGHVKDQPALAELRRQLAHEIETLRKLEDDEGMEYLEWSRKDRTGGS